MFVYLSKKIAMTNNTILHSVAWDGDQGYIACGGDDGLLKVLKLDSQLGSDTRLKGLAAPYNISMNQSLEGHNGSIRVITWNEQYKKLTTSDQYGMIIVWMFYRGEWHEEMINNRNKSYVTGIRWNSDGQKICIVYHDGCVIVGTVNGSRIWGKELAIHLTHVEWSPDSKTILFAEKSGNIHVYDSSGNFITKMNILCLELITGSVQVTSVDWYNGIYGHDEVDCPVLAVCFDIGRVQIMRSETDSNPILLDTGMLISHATWNRNGSMLAIAGSQKSIEQEMDVNLLKFYTPYGDHLRTLNVPGKNLESCTWESSSLRIAMSVDSFLYFANIRQDYKWGYCINTLVYSFRKVDAYEHCVVFWNINTQEKYVKNVKNLVAITACGEYCCLATRSDDVKGQYTLALCNSIGTALDSKTIDLEPCYITMTSSHIAVASKAGLYTWQFKNFKQMAAFDIAGKRRSGSERLCHIDEIPTGSAAETIDYEKVNSQGTEDCINCICASEKTLVVGRLSGSLHRYSIATLNLTQKHVLTCQPQYISINSSSSCIAIIDVAGFLSFFEFDSRASEKETYYSAGSHLQFEKKDTWDMKWAHDDPELFAVMQKTKMHVFRGTEIEEAVTCNGYICQFKDLNVKMALLDEICQDPKNPNPENVFDLQTKSPRDLREILDKSGLEEAMKFVDSNPHIKLWQILAEAALEHLDLNAAELAFVKCQNLGGIQFVKRLGNLQNENLKKAEIAAHLHKFDEAEKLYMNMDRRDLAVNLRKQIGDWFRVIQLLKTGGGGDDLQLEEAWNAIGDYYADRQKWQQAVTYYVQGRNQESLCHCYYMLEDYSGMERMVQALTENHSLLPKIASLFMSVGMCEQAVSAFTKCNRIKEAIDCCVRLNHWMLAIELSRTHHVKEIDATLIKYTEHLLSKNDYSNAIKLYREAGHFLEAAKLLYEVAEKQVERRVKPLLLKKIYVLAGLMIEQHHEQVKQNAKAKTKREASSALASLWDEDSSIADTKFIDNAWRGAEAYHFYLLAQKQFYAGYLNAAMVTALHLQDYDDIIDPLDIYSLIALISCKNSSFQVCSKAFVKLESLDSPDKGSFRQLALDIFSKHAPRDVRINTIDCTSCGSSIPDWCTVCPNCDTKYPTCIASGRPLVDYQCWLCAACKHRAYEGDIRARANCPLCHSLL